MSIAIFKPFSAAADEGERVWKKLVQKVIEAEELAAHTAAGWFTDANEALSAADTAQVEAENAALQSQITEAQTKLDGRTKAARDAKKADTPVDPAADSVPLADGGAADTPVQSAS